MSQKIPFLQMFAALRQWTELSNGVEGWRIVSAAIDKASRSAKITVEGAAGAGPNLMAQAEEALCRAYGLNSVKIEAAPAPEADGDCCRGAQCAPAGGHCPPLHLNLRMGHTPFFHRPGQAAGGRATLFGGGPLFGKPPDFL